MTRRPPSPGYHPPVIPVLLLDLYDTIAFTDWNAHARGLAARLRVPLPRLMEAYEVTRGVRGAGSLGSIAADLGALTAACGLTIDEEGLAGLAADFVHERTT